MAKKKEDDDKPLFEQAKHSLVHALTVGEYSIGEVLPPIEDLAARIKCSTGTMRRALTELAQEGLVKRIQRRGTVVTKKPDKGRICLVLSGDLHTNMIFQDAIYSAMVGAGYYVDIVPNLRNFADVAAQCKRLREAPHYLDCLLMLSPVFHNAEERALFDDVVSRYPRCVVYSLDDRSRFPNTPLVATDQQQAAKDIMEHLLSLGHKKIGGFAGYNQHEESWPVEFGRYAGHLLNVAGAEFVPHHGHPEREDELNKLFRKDGVTAFCCVTDHQAVLLVNLCHRLGLRVPQDVSIVGRNDTPWSRECTPLLTTVSLNPEGTAAALLDCLEKQRLHPGSIPFGSVIRVLPKLMVRESTGPAPKSARKK